MFHQQGVLPAAHPHLSWPETPAALAAVALVCRGLGPKMFAQSCPQSSQTLQRGIGSRPGPLSIRVNLLNTLKL